ncbi:prospero-like protein PROX1 [Saccoglossus kowalevskii]|uniref:Prospero-like protein PROX1 n=1 Tax=Saccoglossus kowalevskii TaxID=10224 RepID=D1LXB9_SACKO|nr:prospero-like protein PROX1 [Saccoglossus kowalevskii]ACY92625.1 prospero-like protein PROX1 [Saccoglossus kowalevskii]
MTLKYSLIPWDTSVDTGLPRNTYGQSQTLVRAMNGNTTVDSNQVLRRLLKPSNNNQEGMNVDGDENLSASMLLSKSKQNGDDCQQGENGVSYMEDYSEGGLCIDEGDLANKENGDDNPRTVEDMSEDSSHSFLNGGSKHDEKCNNVVKVEESMLAKRARVENIVTSMRQSPSRLSECKISPGNEARKQKRKQNTPQPQRVLPLEEKQETRKEKKKHLKHLLSELQDHLNKLQSKYFELYEHEETDSDMDEDIENGVMNFIKGADKDYKSSKTDHVKSKDNKNTTTGNNVQSKKEAAIVNGEEKDLFSDALKNELTTAVSDVVDSVVRKFVKEKQTNSQSPPSSSSSSITSSSPVTDSCNMTVAHENHNLLFNNNTSCLGQFAKNGYNRESNYQSEQTEALPLVVSHKNRDRPSRESTPRMEVHHDFEPAVPATLPTSVAIPNPGLQYSLVPHLAVSLAESHEALDMSSFSGGSLLASQAAALHTLHQQGARVRHEMSHHQPEGLSLSLMKSESDMSPIHHHHHHHDLSGLDTSSYSAPNSASLNTTLTPAHLKKAKLMFFFARYPSSTVLKQHFPDVKFNRHNTAQLIKWFSNFREFYYIQMEKFARQYMSEGVKNPEMLQVLRDAELFKVLNLHYNKSNEFEVPDNFLVVSRKTLIEFFNAIKAGKDADTSWKKAIYKVISKLDDPLPEFFRAPDCLEELERMVQDRM